MNACSVPVLSPALSPGPNRHLAHVYAGWGRGHLEAPAIILTPGVMALGSLGALTVMGTLGMERPRSLSQDKRQGLWSPFC